MAGARIALGAVAARHAGDAGSLTVTGTAEAAAVHAGAGGGIAVLTVQKVARHEALAAAGPVAAEADAVAELSAASVLLTEHAVRRVAAGLAGAEPAGLAIADAATATADAVLTGLAAWAFDQRVEADAAVAGIDRAGVAVVAVHLRTGTGRSAGLAEADTGAALPVPAAGGAVAAAGGAEAEVGRVAEQLKATLVVAQAATAEQHARSVSLTTLSLDAERRLRARAVRVGCARGATTLDRLVGTKTSATRIVGTGVAVVAVRPFAGFGDVRARSGAAETARAAALRT